LLLVVYLLSAYRLLVKEPPKMVLRRMMGPSLETGAVLDAALSGNYCANRDCVSAIAVTLVCDEKGAGVESQERRWDFSTQSPRTFFITVLTPYPTSTKAAYVSLVKTNR
jgi:hypothetical protein